jgi:hypothetical protein
MISTSKRGVSVEYQAVTLFLEAGFEVFINAAPDGPADLVVWDGTSSYFIDTKLCQKIQGATGWYLQNKPPAAKQVANVIYLGKAGSEWFWLTPPPIELSTQLPHIMEYRV